MIHNRGLKEKSEEIFLATEVAIFALLSKADFDL